LKSVQISTNIFAHRCLEKTVYLRLIAAIQPYLFMQLCKMESWRQLMLSRWPLSLHAPIRPVPRGRIPPRKFFSPAGKLFWTSSKNLDPSRKTLRLSWCPKLVTGLAPIKK